MEINWKIGGVFGGAAFLLSFLVGLISSVGFGTVFLRSIIGAAVFAGIGTGITLVVKKHLPGLAGEEGEETETETGGVNIVIEEESPGTMVQDTSDDDEINGAAGGFVEEVEEQTSDGLIDAVAEDDDEGAAAKGEAVEVEEIEDAEEAEVVEDVEEIEELGEAEEENGQDKGNKKETVPAEVLGVIDDDAGVDELPDMGNFAGAFDNGGFNDEGGDGSVSSISEGGSNTPVDILGKEESPATVAKAVQTMLKKE